MKQSGFTLIESLLVVLLMGIVSLMLFVGSRQVERITFHNKVREVVNSIEYIKSAAAMTGSSFTSGCFTHSIRFSKEPTTVNEIFLGDSMEIPKKSTDKLLKFTGTIAPEKARTIIINNNYLKISARITVGVGTGKVRVYLEEI